MRYETPVRTGLHFGTGDGVPLEEVEVCTIAFGGRSFEWHSNLVARDGCSRDFPTITTMALEGDDQQKVDTDTQRLLSALAFLHEAGLSAEAPGATGFAGRFANSAFRCEGAAVGGLMASAPSEVQVEDDPVLRHALALYREGLTAVSPFYRFLAFWNALDTLFDGVRNDRAAYLRAVPADSHLLAGCDPVPADLAQYLTRSSRNAIAHAFRPNGSVLDPDASADRYRLLRDSRLLGSLAQGRIYERWRYPVWSR